MVRAFWCQESSTTSSLTRALARIRLRLRDPTDDQSRQQVEEEGKICSPGQTGATHGAVSVQGGTFKSQCANERDESPEHILIGIHRRLNMQDISAP